MIIKLIKQEIIGFIIIPLD